jgi:hypothetical protein
MKWMALILLLTAKAAFAVAPPAPSPCDNTMGLSDPKLISRINEIAEKSKNGNPFTPERIVAINNLLVQAIYNNELLVFEQTCNLQTHAKYMEGEFKEIGMHDSIDRARVCAPACTEDQARSANCPDGDPACYYAQKKCTVKYDHSTAGWGPVASQWAIQTYHTRLKKLVDCQNYLAHHTAASAPSVRPVEMPKFKLVLHSTPGDGNFHLTSSGLANQKATCREPLGVKVAPGTACLLRKSGFWDGKSPDFLPPPSGRSVPYMESHKQGPDVVNSALGYVAY